MQNRNNSDLLRFAKFRRSSSGRANLNCREEHISRAIHWNVNSISSEEFSKEEPPSTLPLSIELCKVRNDRRGFRRRTLKFEDELMIFKWEAGVRLRRCQTNRNYSDGNYRNGITVITVAQRWRVRHYTAAS